MIKAWHFLPADRCLRYEDRRKVVDGESLEMAPNQTYPVPTLCESGMHASIKLLDALSHAPGLVLCRVAVSGDVVEGSDKITGRHRRNLHRSLYDYAVHLGVIK